MLHRIADGPSWIARLGVEADVTHLLLHLASRGVDVNVAVSSEMFQDGHACFCNHCADEIFSAAGDGHVDKLIQLQEARDKRAVGRFHQLHGTGRKTGLLERLGNDPGDDHVGVQRFLPAAQNDRVSTLDAYGGRIAGDVGTTFIEEKHDTQRNAPLLHAQSIRTNGCFDRLSDRIDLLSDLIDSGGHRFHAPGIQLQPFQQGCVEIAFFCFVQIQRVCIEQCAGIVADRRRHPMQRIDLG